MSLFAEKSSGKFQNTNVRVSSVNVHTILHGVSKKLRNISII